MQKVELVVQLSTTITVPAEIIDPLANNIADGKVEIPRITHFFYHEIREAIAKEQLSASSFDYRLIDIDFVEE